MHISGTWMSYLLVYSLGPKRKLQLLILLFQTETNRKMNITNAKIVEDTKESNSRRNPTELCV